MTYTPSRSDARAAYKAGMKQVPGTDWDETGDEFDRFIRKVEQDIIDKAIQFTDTEQCPAKDSGGMQCRRPSGHSDGHRILGLDVWTDSSYTLRTFRDTYLLEENNG